MSRVGSGAEAAPGASVGVGVAAGNQTIVEATPLDGRRVLICRAAEESTDLIAGLTALGAAVVAHPLIRTEATADPEALRAAAARWNSGDYDWVVVTSARGAAAFVEAGAGPLVSGAIAAVGPATAAALSVHGFTTDLMPERDFSGAGLTDALLAALAGSAVLTVDSAASTVASAVVPDAALAAGLTPTPSSGSARVLLPVSALADDTIERALTDAGHMVHRVEAYRTVASPDAPAAARLLANGDVEAALVLSASAARELAAQLANLHEPGLTAQLSVHLSAAPSDEPTAQPSASLSAVHTTPPIAALIAIGEPTAAALRDSGLPVAAVANPHTSQGLIQAVNTLFAQPHGGVVANTGVTAAETARHILSPRQKGTSA